MNSQTPSTQTQSTQKIPRALVQILLAAIPILAVCYVWAGTYSFPAQDERMSAQAIAQRLQPVATVAMENAERK